ncbi:cytochrome c [Xanthobacter sp. V0B-10]|uniref:c-type cytochrome n=1 Tax=Xanthobacter albus TaxID=3119929 RepID=UPI0037290603
MRKPLLLAAALGLLAPLASAPAGAEDLGRGFFNSVCAACHGEGGVGTEGLAPPLVDAELWARLGDKAPAYVSGVLASGLSGRITANGQDYIGLVMPPQAEAGTPEQLAAAATYVLQELNRTTQKVTPAQVEAALKAPLAHKQLRALREGQ